MGRVLGVQVVLRRTDEDLFIGIEKLHSRVIVMAVATAVTMMIPILAFGNAASRSRREPGLEYLGLSHWNLTNTLTSVLIGSHLALS